MKTRASSYECMAGEEMKRMYYGYQNGVAVGLPDRRLAASSPSKRREGLRPLIVVPWAPSKPPTCTWTHHLNNAHVLNINLTFCISKVILVFSSMSTVFLFDLITCELDLYYVMRGKPNKTNSHPSKCA